MESRLKKYISSLSEEERILYKPLIEDALRRDEALSMTVAEARAQAEMFDYQMGRLRESAERFHAGISKLNGKLAQLAEYSEHALRKHSGDDDGGYSKLRH